MIAISISKQKSNIKKYTSRVYEGLSISARVKGRLKVRCPRQATWSTARPL